MRAVLLLLVVVGLSGAVEWMVESSLAGLLWLPGLPFWLGLGLVDVVDPRAWALPPKKVLRRRRQLLDAVVVVPTAPTTTMQIPTAMGESALKPLSLLSNLYPWGFFLPTKILIPCHL